MSPSLTPYNPWTHNYRVRRLSELWLLKLALLSLRKFPKPVKRKLHRFRGLLMLESVALNSVQTNCAWTKPRNFGLISIFALPRGKEMYIRGSRWVARSYHLELRKWYTMWLRAVPRRQHIFQVTTLVFLSFISSRFDEKPAYSYLQSNIQLITPFVFLTRRLLYNPTDPTAAD